MAKLVNALSCQLNRRKSLRVQVSLPLPPKYENDLKKGRFHININFSENLILVVNQLQF